PGARLRAARCCLGNVLDLLVERGRVADRALRGLLVQLIEHRIPGVELVYEVVFAEERLAAFGLVRHQRAPPSAMPSRARSCRCWSETDHATRSSASGLSVSCRPPLPTSRTPSVTPRSPDHRRPARCPTANAQRRSVSTSAISGERASWVTTCFARRE